MELTMDMATIAANLATEHGAGTEHDVIGVYWLPDPKGIELRLVEVLRSVETTQEIMPFRFAPTDDVPVPSVMVLVSEGEFAQLQSKQLRLPDSWGPDAVDELRKVG